MSSAAEYWVGPTIGEGAFGHVVYAIHKATERKVAIKVMEVPTTTTTTSHRAREEHRHHLRHHEEHQLKQKTAMILNERRILSLPGLKSSKWIVDLWAAFCGSSSSSSFSSRYLYFVMELATGGDLAGLIRRGLLSSSSPSSSSSKDHRFGSWRRSSVPWYASQLIEAVEFLHSRGILHCDLKPENVLLDATTGHLLLADFGCALDTKQQQQQQQEPEEPQSLLFPRGTALYASPEILRASSPCVLTVAVDYWSVGCILHAMLHGQSPFDRGSEALTVRAIVAYAAGEKECDCDSAASNATSSDECESDKGCFETSNRNKNDNEDRAIGDSRNRNKNITKNKPPNAIPSTERSGENENEDQDDDDQDDDDDSLQPLSQDLLAVDPDDRISAWKNSVLSFLASNLNSNDRDGDNDDGNYLFEDGSSDPPSGKDDIPPSVSACASNKDILLPIPGWEDEVANATLRDGRLGWFVFQI